MNIRLTLCATLTIAAMVLVGCQEQKTVGLEPGIGQPEQPKKGFFESLAFWESDQKEPEPVQYQPADEEKPDALAGLWPGNWFKGDDKITKQDIWNDMSPELWSIDQTPDEITTMHRRTIDTNLRQISNDADNALLLDKPSHLSLYPVP